MFGFDTLSFYFCFLNKHSIDTKIITEEEKKKIKEILDSDSPLKHDCLMNQFRLIGTESLINITFKMLIKICNDPITMIKLCTNKLNDTVPNNMEERSYTRTASYSIIGSALYFYLVLIEERKAHGNYFPMILTDEHIFELYLPFIKTLFRAPMIRSEERRVGKECLLLVSSRGWLSQ